MSIADSLYPGSESRVVFPIEPETFFVEDPVTATEPIESETPKTVAG